MLRTMAATPAEAWRDASALIVAALRGRVSQLGDGAVLVFLPDDREPAIDPAIEAWIGEGRSVAAPRVDWTTGRMRPTRLRSINDVERRRHGVREPLLLGGEAGSGSEVGLGEIGVVLVPGVAFDAGGGRLGRGGGYYDRLLSRPGLKARRVGVCFDAQVLERVPVDGHDRRVDELVTEAGSRAVSPDAHGVDMRGGDKYGPGADVADDH